MTHHNEDSLIPISETLTTGNLKIIQNNNSEIISATNNRAQYYAEQAKKYKDDTYNYMLTTKGYAEVNTNITQSDLDNLSDNIIDIINDKEDTINQSIDDIEDVIENIKSEALVGKSGCYLTTDGENLSWDVINLDEYDQAINSLENDKVNKSGDSMTGDLTIQKDNAQVNVIGTSNAYSGIIARTTAIHGTSTIAPESTIYGGRIYFQDADNIGVGWVQSIHNTQNRIELDLGARRNINGTDYVNTFNFGVDANGKPWYSRPQIITAYVSGTSGYNIWSNGYCEQWGVTSGGDNETVTLLKSFKDTNYIVNYAHITNANGDMCPLVFDRTVNSFVLVRKANYTTTKKNWQASGYLASGQY